MKFKRKACFMEFAVLLLQRTMQEDHLELVLQWGHDIFGWLSRRDEGLTGPKKGPGDRSTSGKELKKFSSSVMEYKKNKASTFWSDKKRKEFLQKKQLTALKAQNTEREYKAVETMLNQLAPLVRRHQRRRCLRQVCSEEWLWSYSQLPLSLFSLAHSGTLVRWRNMPQHIGVPDLIPPPPKATTQPRLRTYRRAILHKAKESGQAATTTSGEDFNTTESSEQDSEQDSPRAQPAVDSDCSEPSVMTTSPTRRTATQLLESLNKAALHLRRAMVPDTHTHTDTDAYTHTHNTHTYKQAPPKKYAAYPRTYKHSKM
ncbi:unnamed protein product [Coregonus sp. 'balchen']|nr:unnamed protein product [Coregonus sp. 'balchen']